MFIQFFKMYVPRYSPQNFRKPATRSLERSRSGRNAPAVPTRSWIYTPGHCR